MHAVINGKLVPERCSGYPFCDICAPPRLRHISEILTRVLEGVQPMNISDDEACVICGEITCQCDVDYEKALDQQWFPEDYN